MSGGTFDMETGSSITGHNADVDLHSAVTVRGTNATFNMNGGEISGNRNFTYVFNSTNVGAGVSVYNGRFNMNGGSITGNFRGTPVEHSPADVYTEVTAVNLVPTLNNNAQIGTLILNASSATANARINIGNNFTGSVGTLNLRGPDNAVATVATWWTGRTVLQGSNVSSHISRFPLGEFISRNNGRQAIAPRVINASGELQ
jgi:hypothetical protein